MGSGVTDCSCCSEHIMVNSLENGPHLCDECDDAGCEGDDECLRDTEWNDRPEVNDLDEDEYDEKD